jgi:lambda repressor-like predicted transcriptional regulator
MPIQSPKAPKASAVRLPVTPEWSASVVDAMRARGLGLRALARQLKIHHATLGTITRGKIATSPHVAAISKAVGVPCPPAAVSARAAKLLAALEQLENVDPAYADHLLDMAEAYAERFAADEPAKPTRRSAKVSTKR